MRSMKIPIMMLCIALLLFAAGCAEGEHVVSLEASPEEGGAVRGAGSYEFQSEVIVEAAPYDGFVFKGWKEAEEIVSTEESYRFVIEEDVSLVAIFEEETAYREVALYFGCTEAMHTGEPGEYGYVCPKLVEITEYSEAETQLQAIMEELIKGPDPEDEKFSPVVYDAVEILDLNIEREDGIAEINLSEEMFGENWPGGSLTGTVFIESVTWTATQLPEVDRVMVMVEGDYWNDGHYIWDEPKSPEKEAAALPAEIEEWVEYSRGIWLAQTREYEGSLYLLVTYGEQPTGGYRVEITDVVEEDDQLTVYVEYTEPGEDNIVTQAITYPYDLVKVEPTDLPVTFVAEGDVEFVPVLENLDWLPPIAAGSEDIRVFTPVPGDTVSRNFAVEGIELVFEGTVLYKLTDQTGKELESGVVTGHGYKWGYFEIDLTIPEEVESGEEIVVELYSESPVDGSIENKVKLELVLE